MTARHRVAAITALALAAGGAALAAATPAQAADAGFTPVHTVDFTVYSITAPDADTVVAVGTKPRSAPGNEVFVEARIGGQWVRQDLGIGDRVQAESDHGVVWIRTTPYGDGYAHLWKSHGSRLEEVALPTDPTGRYNTFRAEDMAVDGDTVVLAGAFVDKRVVDGQPVYTSGPAQLATLKNGTWTTIPKSVGLFGAASGRVIGYTSGGRSDLYVWDVTGPQNIWYGTAGGWFPGKPDASRNLQEYYSAATLENGYNFTLWGTHQEYDSKSGYIQVNTGLCKRFGGGTAVQCPAPQFPVVAASALPDGRAVLAGHGGDHWHQASSGFAVAGTDGSITPVAGDASQATDVAAAAVGTKAWAAVLNGPEYSAPGSTILEADLAR